MSPTTLKHRCRLDAAVTAFAEVHQTDILELSAPFPSSPAQNFWVFTKLCKLLETYRLQRTDSEESGRDESVRDSVSSKPAQILSASFLLGFYQVIFVCDGTWGIGNDVRGESQSLRFLNNRSSSGEIAFGIVGKPKSGDSIISCRGPGEFKTCTTWTREHPQNSAHRRAPGPSQGRWYYLGREEASERVPAEAKKELEELLKRDLEKSLEGGLEGGGRERKAKCRLCIDNHLLKSRRHH
ncbi:hypothetical protein DFH06DRAFT_1139271 [Mycena polygramma]|nr:hypothetical protein DFH06DRAFT_1139271 [Mycena polygramma]